jgi:pSer/pThr/pTyr-binding forkhead associated (FHA) protein
VALWLRRWLPLITALTATCVVSVGVQRAKLLDLNSLNGVFRNGVKIIGGSEDLVSGDTIRFGYDPAEFT